MATLLSVIRLMTETQFIFMFKFHLCKTSRSDLNHVSEFNDYNKRLTVHILKQRCRHNKFRKSFLNFMVSTRLH